MSHYFSIPRPAPSLTGVAIIAFVAVILFRNKRAHKAAAASVGDGTPLPSMGGASYGTSAV